MGSISYLQLLLLFKLLLLSAASNASIATHCSDPGIPTNGYRNGNDFSVGESVQFGCKYLNSLIGTETLTCEAKETRSSTKVSWSDHTPVCLG